MLAAIGGRAAWVRTTNTINDSQQNRVDVPTVVRAVITMDFTRPRFRIESTAPGINVVRAVNGPEHWRITRDGTLEGIPPEVLEADLLWYAGHVYRTIHRIAARDTALSLAVSTSGRLEVYEAGSRIAWFALDADGEPYMFGAHGDDVGSVSGPWNHVQDGIHHPSWVARPDGTWRAQIRSLVVNAELSDSIFTRPGTSPSPVPPNPRESDSGAMAVQGTPDPWLVADRMIASLGGREVWGSATDGSWRFEYEEVRAWPTALEIRP